MKSVNSPLPQHAGQSASSVQGHLQGIARFLRLQILAQVSNPTNMTERKKTALHSSHCIAVLYGLLHLLPITACSVLVALNFKTLYIGTIPTASLTAFQFASKLLEVFIQASITAIVLGFVRIQVLGAQAFPLGGLIAPFRITDLSLLWSLELWGFITSTSANAWNRAAMCLLLPTTAILAAIVGPSSAVLMIPRPISYPTFSYINLLPPMDVLYPIDIKLNNSELVSESEFISSWSNYWIGDFNVSVVTLTGGWISLWSTELTYQNSTVEVATLPSTLSNYLLQLEPDYYDEAVISTAQPYVYIDCWCSEFYGNLSLADDQYIDFGPEKQDLNSFIPKAWLMPDCSASSADDSFAIMPTVIDADGYINTMAFSRPPRTDSNYSLLLAQAAISPDPQDSNPLCGCTVDASWIPWSVTQQGSSPASLNGLSNSESPSSLGMPNEKTEWNMSLSPEWMIRVMSLTNASTGMFGSLRLTAPATALALSYVPPYTYLAVFSGNLQTVADMPLNYTTLSAQQYDETMQFIKDKHLNEKYSMVFAPLDHESWSPPENGTQLVVHGFLEGYGYDASTLTVRLSLAVIMSYLVMATAYLMYSVTAGLAASSWNSIAELVALALNSERPDSLKDTSVGIDTLGTYRQLVNVRVNKFDSLELVFDGDGRTDQLKLVEKNKKY